ncbi:MAG: ABC-2 type transport system ATP-binding protein [Cyclobacteriaceae bacterium]|jgi:ABC-2 type transport system ATP-binding protein
MSVIVQNLSKVYGTQWAIDNVSFEAKRGRILGFLGPNGAGKSTTMKIATGYIRPTSGDVLVEGLSVISQSLKVKQHIGYLPEHNPMYMDMYAKEFLRFVAQAYQLPPKRINSRIDEMIELCGLTVESHKKLRMLSKGYRQRVGLAKALVADPSVLILDEPTTGLDPNQLLEVRKVIKRISEDKTVILSTHIMQEVEALCDDVVIIDKGRLVANQSLADLKKAVQVKKVHVTFETKVKQDLFQGIADLLVEQIDDETISFASEDPQLRSLILKVISEHNLPLSTIQEVGDSLEDIFHGLTQKEGGQA